jgi:hypothetical protein
MASRLLVLNRLMMRERLAIAWLRGVYPVDMDGSERAAFDALRQKAGATGLSIGAPESPYVSQDEASLLAGLALLQRQRPPSAIEFPEVLRVPLFDCARRLKAAGIGLHLRLMPPIRAADQGHARPTCRIDNVPAAIEPRQFVQRSTLQGKVFAFVSDRGLVAASELGRLGASRQVISIMYKRGLLRRVRFGVYTASPDGVVLTGP